MSGSAYIFPAALLALPVQLQHRLPPQLQAIDIQFALVLHALLALAASAFTLHPSYLLPLSLFGLAATHHSLTSLLPHFVAFWVLSIPLDLVWLLNKGSDARLIVVSAVGASMILKVPSAVSAAQMASSEGYLPQQDSRRDEAGFGVFAGVGASLPGGLWSGAGGEARDVPGGYCTFYDDEEEDNTLANRKPHTDIESGRGKTQGQKTQSKPAQSGRGGYSSID